MNQARLPTTSIDVVGTAAQVRIRFVIDNTRPVTHFFDMLEIDNTWRVVNIIDF